MKIHHSRVLGILSGHLGAALAAGKEFVWYHKSNGVDYEVRLAFGGDAMRMALSARYESLAELHAYFARVMNDPRFQEASAKHAGHWLSGSARDEIWAVTHAPEKASAGPLVHQRILGVLPGREAAAAGAMREFVDYHASRGVFYTAYVPAGAGDPLRVALAARFASAADLESYVRRLMGDPVFQALAAKHAANWVTGSVIDHMWTSM